MNRFVPGAIYGAAGSAIAYAAGANAYWTVGVGVVVAFLIWFSERIVAAIERCVGWLERH